MRNLTKVFLGATSLVSSIAGSAYGQTAPTPPGPPGPAPMAMPSMAGPLAANPAPMSFDLSGGGFDWLLGKVYVTGALTGMAYAQTNAHEFNGDRDVYADLTNGQVVLQKTDGFLQWYVEVGSYSFPSLGTPYTSSGPTPGGTFTAVPEAFFKFAFDDSINVEVGKLPTLIGDEYNFTFQNMNIERGLLWGQEPAISQGAQANYTSGPLTISVSLNDGYYSNRLNVVSGLISYGFNAGADTLAFSASGNLGHTGYGRAGSTLWQNNDSIYNLIYTHTSGAWTVSPYIQYVTVPKMNFCSSMTSSCGLIAGGSSISGALLVSYGLSDNWKLAGRFEYVETSGGDNFLYGNGSNAFTFTLTPTWQYKVFFVRPEVSYVSAGSITSGFGLGALGRSSDQFRGMLEAGVVF
jgi:hypothetical protein